MKCPNCGAELAEDAKFCGNCGTAVPAQEPVAEEPIVSSDAVEAAQVPADAAETAQPKAPSKVKMALDAFGAKVKPIVAKAQPVVDKCKPFVQKNKLWLAGAGCLAVLLILVLIVVSIFMAGNGFTPVEHSISAFCEDGEVLLRYDNKKVINTGVEAAFIEDEQVSIDGNVYVFLTNEDQLVVAKGKKVTVVSDDVTEFRLSVTGKGLGYVTEDEAGKATLKLQKVGSKKVTTVLEDYNRSSFDLSPDGKSMVYYKYDEESNESDLMYFNGSKHTKITSSEVTLVGLANKGKYIYVVGKNDEGDDILYSYNTKGDKQKLGSCLSMAFCFNEDHTQILFFDGSLSMSGIDAKTYISTKGKEAQRISSSLATPMVPQGSAMSTQGAVATVPTNTLFNKVYTCYKDGQTNAWLIKKNVDKSSKLVSNIDDDAILDASAEYLYYTNKDSNLMMLKVSHGDRASDKSKLIAEDVENFVVTSDRKRVYFISEDSLYSCNGKNGRSKKTIANEDLGYTLVLNQNDICYYFVDGDVYASSNGRKGKLVVAEADELYSSSNGIVYVETEDAMFATKTAKKPAKIHTYD